MKLLRKSVSLCTFEKNSKHNIYNFIQRETEARHFIRELIHHFLQLLPFFTALMFRANCINKNISGETSTSGPLAPFGVLTVSSCYFIFAFSACLFSFCKHFLFCVVLVSTYIVACFYCAVGSFKMALQKLLVCIRYS